MTWFALKGLAALAVSLMATCVLADIGFPKWLCLIGGFLALCLACWALGLLT